MLDLDISVVKGFTHRLQDIILEIWYVERILQWVVVLGGRFSRTNRIPICKLSNAWLPTGNQLNSRMVSRAV